LASKFCIYPFLRGSIYQEQQLSPGSILADKHNAIRKLPSSQLFAPFH
jgi:hypothetical protein